MAAIVAPENVERNREILQHYTSGLSYDAVAAQMGLSRGVVAGVLHRAGAKCRGGVRRPFDDLTGKTFGHWTVLCPTGTMFLCRCVCGRRLQVRGLNLKRGLSKSCGCMAGGRGRPRKDA